MNSDLPKVLAPLAGRPMVAYVLDAIMDAQIDAHPLVVIGHQSEKVREALKEYPVEFVEQTEQKGTGHALAVCERFVDRNEDVLVLYGDQPLVRSATIGTLADEHQANGATVTMMTYTVPTFDVYNGLFTAFGRIIRSEDGKVQAIREYKDATEEEKQIHEVNPAYYVFSAPWVWDTLKRLDTKNAQGEYYLTDLIALAIQDGEAVETVAGESLAEAVGVNTQEQLQLAETLISLV